jgi:hypothetical protein
MPGSPYWVQSCLGIHHDAPSLSSSKVKGPLQPPPPGPEQPRPVPCHSAQAEASKQLAALYLPGRYHEAPGPTGGRPARPPCGASEAASHWQRPRSLGSRAAPYSATGRPRAVVMVHGPALGSIVSRAAVAHGDSTRAHQLSYCTMLSTKVPMAAARALVAFGAP